MHNLKTKAAAGLTPKILLTDTNRWSLAARLAISLSEAGCEVSAVCAAQGHALLKTRAVRRTHPYSGLRPLKSLSRAIRAAEPDIIIPCCDRSVEHLHELYAQSQSGGENKSKLAAVIERSLGSPRSHSIVSSRYELLKLAGEQGIRVPRTSSINTPEELESWLEGEQFPWVLKADRTWGGGGVAVIHTAAEVQRSLTQLARLFRPARAIKRTLINRDPFWLSSWWQGSQHAISAQSYIQGRPANCSVVCWEGRVLAGIGVAVIVSEGLTGPASVVRIVDNSEMMFAADRIASRLGLSGFFGLDFVIEEGSGAAYMIEMNPRTTPPCYLRLGKGRDLAGALWAQLAGRPQVETMPVTQNQMIAYFPQAWQGDRELLQSCFQDVPQGEPELVEELLHPFPERTLLFRLAKRLARKGTLNYGASATNVPGQEQLKTYEASACGCREIPTKEGDITPLAVAPMRSGSHDLS
jgi:carbamoylphosphate synthase large subunit